MFVWRCSSVFGVVFSALLGINNLTYGRRGRAIVSLHKQLVSVVRQKKPMGLPVVKPMVHGRLNNNAYIYNERPGRGRT